jgi:nucleotide-binding universal stress UspA family protein
MLREGAMSMRAILVPLEQNDYTQSVLACAHLLAGRFGGHIQGFAFFPMYEVYGFGDMTPLWVTEGRPSEELAGEARKVFDRFMRQEAPSGAGGAPVSFSWLTESDPGDIFVASHARVFDITILGRPGYDPSGPRSSTLEAVLFESGRPCLIAPPTPPRELGDNIVIAWNRSTETALAVAHAMPLLHQAKRVTILTVEGGTVPGPSGDELANGLKLNGIETQAVTVNAGKRTSGEMILDYSASIGADLLIKGAYTQSRLRQMIFGGATSHILGNANLPVFMAR